ncbi:YlbL family protein [Planctomonas deserti]|uniref:YlbL family protein n=1 Tax=Planctomonas deserti TaxID=2144185 RepID=UPI000D39B7A7|nr:S16 family serine protease [Planctomonas deserti]
MSVFAQYARDATPRRGDRGRAGVVLLSAAFVLVLLLGIVPTPYVIEQPGPVYDTLGTSEHEGTNRPLISIPSQETFPTTGELNLLTVSVLGSPETPPHWLDVATAWFDPSKAVVPVESVFPPDVSRKERDEENRVLMVNSQRDAIAAALLELGYEVPGVITVQGIVEGEPAEGIVEEGDRITSVNGTAVTDYGELQDLIAKNGSDRPVELGLTRDGSAMTLQVTPRQREDASVIGVLVTTDYTFPFDVSIQLDDVGGPSAGMMFALGIIDKLEPGELTGGENIAGTGTIDAQGVVGPIGGIRQKLYGAERAGADYFLAPARNCDEVVGHVPDGLDVFAVSTLDDSLAVLKAVADDTSLADLPRCAAE